jgi:diaminohydroxyphosphoribosylaminopyrimidine deaminase/5-amino-6-(5-phosphoribosylamino)uracil reductase
MQRKNQMPTPICEAMMSRAVELSKQGFPAPNPRVGCVIERDGQVVGEGYHDHAGGPHAEIVALREAEGSTQGATVHVTLEPCNHHGRTGPCSEALIAAGVSKVVYAVADPNPVASGGAARLRAAGIEVLEGVLAESAAEANFMWLTAVRRQWPYIVGKAAISMDGRTSLPNGSSKWITGKGARAQGQLLRAQCGAVLVGRGTVERDDPSLTVRDIDVVNQPRRIVLDRYRTLRASRKLFNGEAPVLRVVASPPGPNEVEAAVEDGRIKLDDLLSKLFRLGITSILIEGGSSTLSRFMEAGLVDRLELFVAAKLLGSGNTWATFGALTDVMQAQLWHFNELRMLGEDIWITASPKIGG